MGKKKSAAEEIVVSRRYHDPDNDVHNVFIVWDDKIMIFDYVNDAFTVNLVLSLISFSKIFIFINFKLNKKLIKRLLAF